MSIYAPITPEVAGYIREAVGPDCVIQDREKLEDFSTDSGKHFHSPELAVEPTSPEQVQALLRLANAYAFPVTPRGMGTGLAGGAVPLYGGVVLSLAKMNRILSIEKENLIAVVEPGVINLELKTAVQKEGLFYPPDPASLDTSCVGGNAATNAGGPSCVKYGTTRDYILGLEAVLPSGERIEAGVQTRKGVVGYDLAHLLVGSEGTLGIITKLYLRLLPHPKAVTTLVAFFPRLTTAMEAVISILVKGHIPSAIEFLDSACLELVGDLLPFSDTEKADTFLLVELDGPPGVIAAEIETVGEVCIKSGALNVYMAPDAQKRAKMWEVRREVSLRIEEGSPVYIPEDIVVPIGRIADFVACLPQFEKDYGIKIYSFGHAGDGNIHLNITAGDQSNLATVEHGIEAILRQVIATGGTISGEHGIGISKKRFMSLELSQQNLGLQMGIKRLFDPKLILNPGKMFEME